MGMLDNELFKGYLRSLFACAKVLIKLLGLKHSRYNNHYLLHQDLGRWCPKVGLNPTSLDGWVTHWKKNGPYYCLFIIGSDVWIYVFAGITIVTLCWPIWFWRWQHYNVKSSSDMMIELWCLEINMSKPIYGGQHLMSNCIRWSS